MHENSSETVNGARPVGRPAAAASARMVPRPQSGVGPVKVSAGKCEKTRADGSGGDGEGGGGDGDGGLGGGGLGEGGGGEGDGGGGEGDGGGGEGDGGGGDG